MLPEKSEQFRQQMKTLGQVIDLDYRGLNHAGIAA